MLTRMTTCNHTNNYNNHSASDSNVNLKWWQPLQLASIVHSCNAARWRHSHFLLATQLPILPYYLGCGYSQEKCAILQADYTCNASWLCRKESVHIPLPGLQWSTPMLTINVYTQTKTSGDENGGGFLPAIPKILYLICTWHFSVMPLLVEVWIHMFVVLIRHSRFETGFDQF